MTQREIIKRLKLSFPMILLVYMFESHKHNGNEDQLNLIGKIIMYTLGFVISLPVFPLMFCILLLLNNEQVENMNVFNHS